MKPRPGECHAHGDGWLVIAIGSKEAHDKLVELATKDYWNTLRQESIEEQEAREWVPLDWRYPEFFAKPSPEVELITTVAPSTLPPRHYRFRLDRDWRERYAEHGRFAKG